MYNFKFKIAVYTLFLFLISPASSQVKEIKSVQPQSKTDNKVSKQFTSVKWKSLADDLTDQLLKDANNTSYSDRPILLARLANLWWKTDNARARKWLKTAVNEVTSDSLNETDGEKAKRLETARKLTKYIIFLDEQLAEILIEKISKDSNQADDRSQDSDELIKTALQIVEQNPKAAKSLGSASLKIGQSYLIFRLLGELNLKDAKLSESLFTEAIWMAKSSTVIEKKLGFVSALSSIISNKYKGKSFSEASQKEFLKALVEIISTANFSPASQKMACQYVAMAVQRISLYQAYFPENAPLILQQSNSCKESLGNPENSVEVDSGGDAPKTADENIKAAKEAKNNSLKEKYFSRAIEKLYQEKDYEKVIAVLEGMDEDERIAFGQESWENWRWECAIEASAKYIKEKDFSGIYRIINNTPKSIRSIVQAGVAKKVKEDKPFALSLLEDARKNVNSFEMLSKDKAELYLSLIPQYTEIAFHESINVFREAVTAVNKSDDDNSDNKPEKNYLPLREVILLPVSLLEEDEITTMNALAEIKKVNSRVRFRLGFLEQVLKKFNESKSKEQQIDNKKSTVTKAD